MTYKAPPKSVVKEKCTGYPGSLSPSEERMNWAISGLRGLQIALLPCRLDHLIKGSEYGPLKQPSTSVWASEQYPAHREIMDPDGRRTLWRRRIEEQHVIKSAYCLFFFPFSWHLVFFVRYEKSMNDFCRPTDRRKFSMWSLHSTRKKSKYEFIQGGLSYDKLPFISFCLHLHVHCMVGWYRNYQDQRHKRSMNAFFLCHLQVESVSYWVLFFGVHLSKFRKTTFLRFNWIEISVDHLYLVPVNLIYQFRPHWPSHDLVVCL